METDKLLRAHGLRVTNFRKQVLALFADAQVAVDSRTIEQQLHPSDRVTVYRTLRSFEDSGIIHRISDPTGAMKFALCNAGCDDHAHHDSHAHFHCQSCDNTICLVGHGDLNVSTPFGFSVKETQVILSGTCASCNQSTRVFSSV